MPSLTQIARVVVFVDADNTLWDTDAVYADAQLGLLADIETATGLKGPTTDRLKFVREFDQEIAATHHKGLRYPPKLLAQAVVLGLQGTNPRTAAKIERRGNSDKLVLASDDADSIGLAYFERLSLMPTLRQGVKKGLRELSQHDYTIMVITEGSKSRCRTLLEWYGLNSLVERVIESPKHPDLYRRVCRLGRGADFAVMIGDQLDRDIQPANEADLKTIYFPGGFRPKWLPSKVEVKPDFVISSFDEAVLIVQEIAEALGYRIAAHHANTA